MAAGRPRRDTFSRQAREEVAHRPPERACCRRAFLAALLRGEGRPAGEGLELRSGSAAVARLLLKLLKESGHRATWQRTTVRALGPSQVYDLRLEPRPEALLQPPDPRRRCCRRAYLAGWFAATGSVSPPRGGYHLEWTARTAEEAAALEDILRREGLEPHRMVRRRLEVLSLKRAEHVAEALSLVGATAARLELEEVRALKETRNQLRRQVNAETANLERSSRAAVRQLACLRLLQARGRLQGLSPDLAEVARLRLRNPELSLRELALRTRPPVARATVGRRLAHLERLAMALGDPLPEVEA